MWLMESGVLCRDRTGRSLLRMGGLVALIIGGGLLPTACGSSASTAASSFTALSSSCIPPAFRLFGAPTAPPKELSTPLEAKVLSSFAVFRRSARPGDELSRLKPEGTYLNRELGKLYELSGYYPAYVRHLVLGGRHYFVIPAYGRSEAVVPAHCLPPESTANWSTSSTDASSSQSTASSR